MLRSPEELRTSTLLSIPPGIWRVGPRHGWEALPEPPFSADACGGACEAPSQIPRTLFSWGMWVQPSLKVGLETPPEPVHADIPGVKVGTSDEWKLIRFLDPKGKHCWYQVLNLQLSPRLPGQNEDPPPTAAASDGAAYGEDPGAGARPQRCPDLATGPLPRGLTREHTHNGHPHTSL